MKRSVNILIILTVILGLGISCQNSTNKNELTILPPGNHRAEIKEVLQASSYTYLLLDEEGDEYWIAATKNDFKAGNTVYHLGGMEMKNFESKDLGRTFEKVFFISQVSDQPIYPQKSKSTINGQTESQKPEIKKIDINIEPVNGSIKIGDLYSSRSEFNGKEVIVRGQVTKVNLNIMNKNWVHIQDGSGNESSYDLTITTEGIPKVGDVVAFKGILAVNKDFGMGYSYEVILEEARILD